MVTFLTGGGPVFIITSHSSPEYSTKPPTVTSKHTSRTSTRRTRMISDMVPSQSGNVKMQQQYLSSLKHVLLRVTHTQRLWSSSFQRPKKSGYSKDGVEFRIHRRNDLIWKRKTLVQVDKKDSLLMAFPQTQDTLPGWTILVHSRGGAWMRFYIFTLHVLITQRK